MPVYQDKVDFFQFSGGPRRIELADLVEELQMGGGKGAIASCRLYSLRFELETEVEAVGGAGETTTR